MIHDMDLGVKCIVYKPLPTYKSLTIIQFISHYKSLTIQTDSVY